MTVTNNTAAVASEVASDITPDTASVNTTEAAEVVVPVDNYDDVAEEDDPEDDIVGLEAIEEMEQAAKKARREEAEAKAEENRKKFQQTQQPLVESVASDGPSQQQQQQQQQQPKKHKKKSNAADGDRSDDDAESQERIGFKWFTGTTDQMQTGVISKFNYSKWWGFLQVADGFLYFHLRQYRPPILTDDAVTLGSPLKFDSDSDDEIINVLDQIEIGSEVLYIPGMHRRGPVVTTWTLKNQVVALKEDFINQPMYKIVATVVQYGPLKADNQTKTFNRTEMARSSEVIWCGVDALDARFHMKAATRKYSMMKDVDFRFEFFISDEDGQFEPCENFIKKLNK